VQITWSANHEVSDLGNPPKPFVAQNWSYRIDPSAVEDSPYISEIMAANSGTLADEDGDYSDWIEIYNPGATSLNLDGWFLTDSTNNLSKWRFPSTNLAGGGFVIVFASEKDRRTPGARLHTNFKLSADGEYLALVRSDGGIATSSLRSTRRRCRMFRMGSRNSAKRRNFLAAQMPCISLVPHRVPQISVELMLLARHTRGATFAQCSFDQRRLLVTARVAKSFYAVASVTMRYRLMYATEVTVPMFDDGAHGDGAANDGVFGATNSGAHLPERHGQMVRYSISASDVTGRSSRWPLFTDPVGSAQYLGTVIGPNYVTSSIPVIHLFSPPNVLHPDSTGGGADSQSGSQRRLCVL
jgi:hypothetical protein